LFSPPAKTTVPKSPQKSPSGDLGVSFSGFLNDWHKQGSLVTDNGQIGFLKERYRDDAVFKSLELNPLQTQRAEQYIKFRDTYHLLYNYEAVERTENAGLRRSLNELYDDFTHRYGNLNDRKNLDLIKMDAGGQEILSLERFDNGKFVKADIFSQPVSFSLNEVVELTDSIEALSASLNKFGEVNAEYMLSLSTHKIENISRSMNGNNELISRMKGDWEIFNQRVQFDTDGNKLNPIKLNEVESADIKILAEKLNHLNDNAVTHGEHYPIGELYGFKLLVKTENSEKEGLFLKENRFFIEGEGHIKYSHNSGRLANDPKLAVQSFLNALEKIPTLIEKYEKENAKLSVDLPVLQEIAQSAWRKENELKDLKTELSALDRKIQLSLAPIDQSEDKPEKTQQNGQTKYENSYPIPERLKEYKNEMGERLVIATLPKYESEKQAKVIKM